MYRPQRNAMMDVMILRRPQQVFAKDQIPRDNVRFFYYATCATTTPWFTCPTRPISASRASCYRSSASPR